MTSKTIKKYHANGKLLLTGEYFVLEGATAIALPTQKGQSLSVQTLPQQQNCLHWLSLDHIGKPWLQATFQLPDLTLLGTIAPTTQRLQHILQQIRKQNPHFLTKSLQITTQLEFSLNWGLGSSSTLLASLAQWANINPYQLLADTFGGSGYDIACAQKQQAILYQRNKQKPNQPSIQTIDFKPVFADRLYFVHLEKKQNSRKAITHFYSINKKHQQINHQINRLNQELISCTHLKTFEILLQQHENLIAQQLHLPKAKDLYFTDYWGTIKSLGAWGGDFVLATSERSAAATQQYFRQKGFFTCIHYKDMVK